MGRMQMGTALAIAGSAMVVAGCGGIGTVRYEGDEVKRAGLGRADVSVYVVDCVENGNLVCSYQGQPLPWRVVGFFRVPSKAAGKWERYQDKVRDRAVEVGCRAIAFRRVPPPRGGPEEPIGAFCLDTATATSAPAAFPTPTAAPSSPQRCNRDGDCASGQSCQHNVCR